MSNDAATKQLLEMSEHEPEEAILYTSYYNGQQRNKQPHDDLSEWATKPNRESPVPTTRLRATQASVFLPRLDLRNILHLSGTDDPQLAQPQSYREDELENAGSTELPADTNTPRAPRHKRVASIGVIEGALNRQVAAQLTPKVSTVVLNLSLPKIQRAKPTSPERYSKYPVMSTSLENSLKRASNRRRSRDREKETLVQLECNGSNPQLSYRSKARLLNDQLSRYLQQVGRCVNNRQHSINGSKIASIKYNFRRRIHHSEVAMDMLQHSLEVRNGAVGRLPN